MEEEKKEEVVTSEEAVATPTETIEPVVETPAIESLDDTPVIEKLGDTDVIPVVKEEEPVVEPTPVVETPAPEPVVESMTEPAPVVETPAPAPAPEPVPEVKPEPVPEPVKEEPKKEPKSTKDKILIVVIIVGLLAIVGLGANMILNGNKDNDLPDADNGNGGEVQPVDNTVTVSEEKMLEIFNTTFKEENGKVTIYDEADGLGVLYNSTYASLFGNAEVDFQSKFTDNAKKLELTHQLGGFELTGDHTVEAHKAIYETLFGGNSFTAAEYKVDGLFECKPAEDKITCTGTTTGGLASPKVTLVKYIDGVQDGKKLTLNVYAVKGDLEKKEWTSHGNAVEGLKGLGSDDFFGESYDSVLTGCKYTLTYDIDDTGFKLVSVKPTE